MKWLLFLVGLVLVGVAAVGYIASIDLLTTETGVLYGACSAIALAAGLIILALGAVTYRIDALGATIARQGLTEARQVPPPVTFAPPVAVDPQWRDPVEPTVAQASAVAPPAPPAPPEVPETVEAEAAAPTLVGRYSAGGASYQIFSDGSIEAQTGQGDFRFASMSEFKAYVAAKKGREVEAPASG
ncbi:MAG TPA: hypothetical protein VKS78_11290 [Roseiarcus sp.]|nr:hypothetical protein [Roseiarcus sp.]